MTTPIKFGTDGWRAIIAHDFTTQNVARVAHATALFILKNYKNTPQTAQRPCCVVGYDCRFGGAMFAETTAKILCEYGITTYLSSSFVSTPMISLATLHYNAYLGVIITASHNPPAYNGYKLKAYFGGPATPTQIQEVENLIPQDANFSTKSAEQYSAEGLLQYINFEDLYVQHLQQHFDLQAIKNSNIKFAYDAMYGAGQNVIPRLFEQATLLHCSYNPSFNGQAPEPLHKNLTELSETLKNDPTLQVGIATDGDADRIGMYDSEGNFVDSHHIILLLIHYLHKYKGLTGKVVIAFSVTDKVKKLCAAYNLPCIVTQIGFKYIAEIMVNPHENVLVGGEESGGIAVKGHIPERDGIWIGLLLVEFMAITGKSLQALIAEIYEIIGAFYYNRNDLHLTNELKNNILNNCKNNIYTQFGEYAIQRAETIDGFKYHLSDSEWVMIRPSGTEPVLRIYAEAATPQGVQNILNNVQKTLLN